MPWQKSYNESKVLESAMLAFWRHGYEATSMQDLVAATGINRGSIYAAFESKRGLFIRSLKHYDHEWRKRHLERIAASGAPVDAITACFEAAVAQGCDDSTPPGCLLVNTALELSPHDPEIAHFVAQSLQGVEDFFHDRIEAATQAGDLAAGIDSRETAQALLGLFLGLRVLTRAGASPAAVETVVSQARKLLR